MSVTGLPTYCCPPMVPFLGHDCVGCGLCAGKALCLVPGEQGGGLQEPGWVLLRSAACTCVGPPGPPTWSFVAIALLLGVCPAVGGTGWVAGKSDLRGTTLFSPMPACLPEQGLIPTLLGLGAERHRPPSAWAWGMRKGAGPGAVEGLLGAGPLLGRCRWWG